MNSNQRDSRSWAFRLRQLVSVPFDFLEKWTRRIVYWIQLARAFGHDYLRYAQHGPRPYSTLSRNQMRAVVSMDYHVLEKALSLKNPRPGFGQEAAQRLLRDAENYVARFGGDWLGVIAADVLQAYCDFNRRFELEFPQLQAGADRIRRCLAWTGEPVRGGCRQVDKQAVLEKAGLDLQAFFDSRFSIRNFAPGDVDPELIARAVGMARKTPSACNRQSWKAYVYSELETKNRLLELQNGHRGFGEQIAKLLVLTADLQAFVTLHERNQAWVDGGMFAMSVVYALHSLGLGTCCLNLCHSSQVERQIKEVGGIPDSEVLLMMVAVGHLPETFQVAASPRRPLAEILVVRS